jgi:hypothetical protein
LSLLYYCYYPFGISNLFLTFQPQFAYFKYG